MTVPSVDPRYRPDHINATVLIFGMVALQRAWIVLYPSRHTGFIGTPPLIAFEVIKTAALLLILGHVQMRIGKEHAAVVRSQRARIFTMAASLSTLIDIGMSFLQHGW